MGKVSKWFRGLLGMKKDKENMDNSNDKTKRRWCFGKSIKNPSQTVTVENDSTRMRSCMSASEKEQNNHAIAVAKIAVATADAAVAGAQAAVAVVRLTSDGRGTVLTTARRALRALRGLVKFQALVKGFVVRKRVAATLYSMQALLRAQLAVRSQRAHRSFKDHRVQPEIRHQKSTERISKKRTKNEAKTTKPDMEWKSVIKTKSRLSPSVKKSTKINPDKSKVKKVKKNKFRGQYCQVPILFNEGNREDANKGLMLPFSKELTTRAISAIPQKL
ncbi:IQ-DOMAIN 31-like protein [Tanacetum coccineum]